ncbi:tail fiber protein 2 [Achromobacter sp. DH1f]|uniref:tail fiber protein 2 n=1 Tax=Achromobacter sp. DH1f TaxID=1397275 RepID=UPI000468894F|nr:tail fiber protein 2 [Achromobacter sp. DH1f]
MQILKPIKVGQAPNDQTGDTLRDAMVVVNENFTKTRSGVDAVEVAVAAAQRKADAAIPAAEKGAAGGVTPLDAAGKVPAAHLPEPAIPLAQKAAPGGVAPLDEGSRVPVDFLPVTEPAVPLAQKGQPGGVATLAADGKITPLQLPDLIPVAEKAQPYGVATLAVDGKIDPSQLPALIPVAEKGRANGVAMLGADGRVPAVQLPAVQDAVPLAEKGLPGGVATLGGDGRVPVEQMPPIPMGLPVATMAWWPLRASIPAGQIPADGQTISRATFPDLAAMVTGGRVPVVPEADWLADPLKRGSYTLGDGALTIRVPDMNGVASGSLAAMVLRGDGARSAGTPGRLQVDQLGPMDYRVVSGFNQATNVLADGSLNAVMPSGNFVGYTFTTTRQTTSGNRWIANTGDETRMANATGVWTIHAFAAVTNPGVADAAQLASDFAVLNAAFQALKGQTLGFGQTLQDMQGQRAFGPTYVNATGRPICVYVWGSTASSAGGNMYLTINSVMATRVIATGNGVTLAMNSVVPSGASYAVLFDNMSFGGWREYR